MGRGGRGRRRVVRRRDMMPGVLEYVLFLEPGVNRCFPPGERIQFDQVSCSRDGQLMVLHRDNRTTTSKWWCPPNHKQMIPL